MKTQNTKLQFSKNSITELSDFQTLHVNGGCQWSNSSGPTKTIRTSLIDIPTVNDDVITIVLH